MDLTFLFIGGCPGFTCILMSVPLIVRFLLKIFFGFCDYFIFFWSIGCRRTLKVGSQPCSTHHWRMLLGGFIVVLSVPRSYSESIPACVGYFHFIAVSRKMCYVWYFCYQFHCFKKILFSSFGPFLFRVLS